MLFQKKKSVKYLSSIQILQENTFLYNGPFQELPFGESLILEKSIYFYDDPNPCFIHRGAVRTRLLGEIEEEILSLFPTEEAVSVPGEKLLVLCSYLPQAKHSTVLLSFDHT